MFPPIRGFIESSLIEWEGMVSSVVVLQGCNLRCPFCHSGSLISRETPAEAVPMAGILDFLAGRRGWVDGVVVSGGEPTVHPELPEFLAAFKSQGLSVKLDTNGTLPDMLAGLLEMGLVDSVAMDLKAPLDAGRYCRAAGGQVDIAAIKRSAKLLLSGEIDHEFRTTVCPAVVTLEDLPVMARSVAGARRFVLQQFVPETALDPKLRGVEPYPKAKLVETARQMEDVVGSCFLRGESRAVAAAGTAAGR